MNVGVKEQSFPYNMANIALPHLNTPDFLTKKKTQNLDQTHNNGVKGRAVVASSETRKKSRFTPSTGASQIRRHLGCRPRTAL